LTKTQRRKQEALLHAALLTGDFLSFFLSFLLAYTVRFYSPLTLLIPVTKGLPPLKLYLFTALFLGAIGVLVFDVRGLYVPLKHAGGRDQTLQCAKAVTLTLLATGTVAFFYRGVSLSRLVFVLTWIIAAVSVPLLRKLAIRIHRSKVGVVSVLVVGNTPTAAKLAELLRAGSMRGYELLDHVGDRAVEDQRSNQSEGLPERYRKAIGSGRADLVVVSTLLVGNSEIDALLEVCRNQDTEAVLLIDQPGRGFSPMRVTDMGGVYLMELKDFPLLGWNFLVKGVVDFFLAGLLLVLLSPVFLLVAIAIKVDSPGPVFFKQKRMGLDGRSFVMWKFRSMRDGAEKDTGPVWAKDDDPRRTGVGRLLRKTSLDELPQLINVVKGDMSIVGPRPERPFFVRQLRKSIPNYWDRHRVKAGITGWAQVNGLRGNTPVEDRIRYDLEYIENWSLWFDIKIMLMTIRRMGSQER